MIQKKNKINFGVSGAGGVPIPSPSHLRTWFIRTGGDGILHYSKWSHLLAAVNTGWKEFEKEKRKMGVGDIHLNPMGRHCP